MQRLQQIETGTRCLPRRVLIYGASGIGCSTFVAGAQRHIFIPVETNLRHLDCHRFPTCKRFDTVF